ncbi:MAG: HAMP domain-containing protein [Deltaproteobacteria bacterium]|jgi:two-component sensor histidine kinase|nr:HAMP domain-containing protein [Deltaproteobacteria bacterium]
MKINSIRFKIMFWFGLCLIISEVLILAYNAVTSYDASIQRAKDSLQYHGLDATSHVQNEFKAIVSNLNIVAAILHKAIEPLEKIHLSRDEVDKILIEVLKGNESFLGVFTFWKANAFDNADKANINEPGFDESGRFSHYWYRNRYGIIDLKTLTPEGAELRVGDRLNFQTAMHEVITQSLVHSIEGERFQIISLIKPITYQNVTVGFIGIDLKVSALQSLISDSAILGEKGKLAILDSGGTVLISTDEEMTKHENGSISLNGADFNKKLLMQGKQFYIQLPESIKLFLPFSLGHSDLLWLTILIPKNQMVAEALHLTIKLIAVGVFCITLSLVIIWFLSGFISNPLKNLVHNVKKIASGDYGRVIEYYPACGEIGSLTSAFNNMSIKIQQRDVAQKKSEEKIKTSLIEKSVLIDEIHHRVKNNMNVVSSLLKLQADSIEDDRTKSILKESQNRIYTMSAIYETIHDSENLSEIDLKKYLSKIVNFIFQTYSVNLAQVKLQTDIEEIPISINQASPLGLTVNELILYSLKYAFPDERKGEISVIMKKLDKEFQLTVIDNGVGMLNELDWKKSNILGLKLVRTLVENQLDGSVEMESNNGTKFTIKFNIET